jgi:hypothetical protein
LPIASLSALALQTAAAGEIAALISANLITASAAVSTLIGVAETAPPNVTVSGEYSAPFSFTQIAAGGEIDGLVNANQITAAQAMTLVDNTVNAAGFSPLVAVTVLTGIASAGTAALQTAAYADLVTLCNINRSMANTVVAELAGIATASAPSGAAPLQSAAGGGIAALISGDVITGSQAMNDIMRVVQGASFAGLSGTQYTGNPLVAEQTVSLFVGIAEKGSPSLQALAGAELVICTDFTSTSPAQLVGYFQSLISSGSLSTSTLSGMMAGMSSGQTILNLSDPGQVYNPTTTYGGLCSGPSLAVFQSQLAADIKPLL